MTTNELYRKLHIRNPSIPSPSKSSRIRGLYLGRWGCSGPYLAHVHQIPILLSVGYSCLSILSRAPARAGEGFIAGFVEAWPRACTRHEVCRQINCTERRAAMALQTDVASLAGVKTSTMCIICCRCVCVCVCLCVCMCLWVFVYVLTH